MYKESLLKDFEKVANIIEVKLAKVQTHYDAYVEARPLLLHPITKDLVTSHLYEVSMQGYELLTSLFEKKAKLDASIQKVEKCFVSKELMQCYTTLEKAASSATEAQQVLTKIKSVGKEIKNDPSIMQEAEETMNLVELLCPYVSPDNYSDYPNMLELLSGLCGDSWGNSNSTHYEL